MNHHGTLNSVLLNFIKTCDYTSEFSKYPSSLMFSRSFIYLWKEAPPSTAFSSLVSHPPVLAPSPPAAFGPTPKTYPFLTWTLFPLAFFQLFLFLPLQNTCSAASGTCISASFTPLLPVLPLQLSFLGLHILCSLHTWIPHLVGWEGDLAFSLTCTGSRH